MGGKKPKAPQIVPGQPPRGIAPGPDSPLFDRFPAKGDPRGDRSDRIPFVTYKDDHPNVKPGRGRRSDPRSIFIKPRPERGGRRRRPMNSCP